MLFVFHCPHCNTPLEADADDTGACLPCSSCNEEIKIPQAQIGIGSMLGNFRVERVVGSGGMGDVYLATQTTMERQVALKVLPQNLSRNENVVKRFHHEVRMSAQLEHTNIVTAFEAGEDSGYHYLAMSYVDGEDLSHKVKRDGALEELLVWEIARQVSEALKYAWRNFRMLHRDIKPGNIMLDKSGRVRLMDLGISKSLDEEQSDLTISGMVVGTPHYMSPEQALGKPLDCRADIYSLGATLYYVVTGATPYAGGGSVEIMTQHLHSPLVSPRERRPEISLDFSNLIKKMMAKNPDERCADWQEIVTEIDRIKENATSTKNRRQVRKPKVEKKSIPPESETATVMGPAAVKDALPPVTLPPLAKLRKRKMRKIRRTVLRFLVFVCLCGLLLLGLRKLLDLRGKILFPRAAAGVPVALENLRHEVAERLLRDDFRKASVLLQNARTDETLGDYLGEVGEMETVIRNMTAEVEKRLGESFTKDRGREIELRLQSGRRTVVIERLGKGVLFLQQALGVKKEKSIFEVDEGGGNSGSLSDSAAGETIKYEELATAELLKRLAPFGDSPAIALYLGLLHARLSDSERAYACFEKSPPVLGKPVKRRFDERLENPL